jgi:hypothetical protein
LEAYSSLTAPKFVTSGTPLPASKLEPLRDAINERNLRKKFGQDFGQVLQISTKTNEDASPISD